MRISTRDIYLIIGVLAVIVVIAIGIYLNSLLNKDNTSTMGTPNQVTDTQKTKDQYNGTNSNGDTQSSNGNSTSGANNPNGSTDGTGSSNVLSETYDIYLVQVSNIDPEYSPFGVNPVQRSTTRKDAVQFMIEQILIGPTDDEKKKGFTNALMLRKPEYAKTLNKQIPTDYSSVIERPTTPEQAKTFFTLKIEGDMAYISFNRDLLVTEKDSSIRVKQQLTDTIAQLDRPTMTYITFNGEPCWYETISLCEGQ